jgi:nondiscriminating glutamyl-tRNA synthetase
MVRPGTIPVARSHAVTRFAPSPTGELHLGNARTALFNFVLARASGGRFLLRIEDTDLERSHDDFVAALADDLRWLGIDWDAGPDRDDDRGPYRQSRRGQLYARLFADLEAGGAVYPCFCSTLELEVSRRAQLASGKPPRYAGTCRNLTAAERARRREQGMPATTRFRVATGRRIEFDDFVHGPQSFESDDIGDFIVRRADGSAAFFFCNAVDDATMGVSHVLRGEDHLANTPRQIMILEALALAVPAYGHVSLLVGADGAPLSKRHGATSVREYRERGYSAMAVVNHLFRLGHSTQEHGLLDLDAMTRAFDARHLGRAPARFDEAQLRVWQKEAVHAMSSDDALAWLRPSLPPSLDDAAARAFIEAVRPNIVLPDDADLWAGIVFGDPPALVTEDERHVREAGPAYFSAAARAAAQHAGDLAGIAAAVREATGRKGAALYMPLRVALTGRAHGPELAPLVKAMTPEQTRARLARFAVNP